MTKLILSPDLQQIFLASLARRCRKPAAAGSQGNILDLTGIAPSDIAYSLSTGVFPVLEIRFLTKLAKARFPDLTKEERRAAVMRGWELAQVRPAEGLFFAGPLRYEWLAEAIETALSAAVFDILGFIRFRMKGYGEFLNLLLTEAEDSLLAEEEDAECSTLLSDLSVPIKGRPPELHIFFADDSTFHLWQRDTAGITQLEGGQWPALEGVLLAELITRKPRRIVIHDATPAERDFLRKLREIFGDRITLEPSPFREKN